MLVCANVAARQRGAVRPKEEETCFFLSASWLWDCHPSNASSFQQWQLLPRAVAESSLQFSGHLEPALLGQPPRHRPAQGFSESESHTPLSSETPTPASSIHSSEAQVSVPWGLFSQFLSFNNATSSCCFLSLGAVATSCCSHLHDTWRLPFSSFIYLWTAANKGSGFLSPDKSLMDKPPWINWEAAENSGNGMSFGVTWTWIWILALIHFEQLPNSFQPSDSLVTKTGFPAILRVAEGLGTDGLLSDSSHYDYQSVSF